MLQYLKYTHTTTMVQAGCKSLPVGATHWFGEMHGSDRWPVGSDRWAYIGSDRCYFFDTLNCLPSLQCSCYWMKKTTMNYLGESCNSSQNTGMLLYSVTRSQRVYSMFVYVCAYAGWQMYSISQEICTRFLLCCALLWLYIDWFSHIHQAYFTGTVAI